MKKVTKIKIKTWVNNTGLPKWSVSNNTGAPYYEQKNKEKRRN